MADMQADRALVVMPAWNEEASIGHVIGEVRAAAPHLDILVVDDGSTDRTRQIALDRGAKVLSLPYNLGVGAALRSGFRYAHGHGYGIVVQVDADGQHDPTDLKKLTDGLEDCDIVIGARFAEGGDYHVSRVRRLAMRVLARSISRRTSTRLTDVTSGFRAFSARSIECFRRDFPAEYLGDTVESLLMANSAGLRIKQVPVVMRPRANGQPSQNTLSATLYLLRAALVLFVSSLRRR